MSRSIDFLLDRLMRGSFNVAIPDPRRQYSDVDTVTTTGHVDAGAAACKFSESACTRARAPRLNTGNGKRNER